MRRALRLPKEEASSRGLRRPFLRIVIAEIAGWGLANVACVLFWTWRAMVAIDLIIVGLHFMRLARVFNVSRYRILGVLFCVIPAATYCWFLRMPRPATSLAGSRFPVSAAQWSPSSSA